MGTGRVVFVDEGTSTLVAISAFDEMDAADAADLIRACCGCSRWVAEVVAGRPYRSMRALRSASDDVVADLRWADLAAALAVRASSEVDHEFARAELGERVRLRLIMTLR